MLKEFKLPELAEGVEKAVVVAILAKPGDAVTAEQIVAELENDKATAELPVPFAGTVKEVFKGEGEEIAVGETLLTIETANGKAAAPAPEAQTAPKEEAPPMEAPAPKAEPAAPTTVAAPQPVQAVPTSQTPGGPLIPAGPEVRRIARELAVDLTKVLGTGPRGRITPQDVKSYTANLLAEKQAAPPPSAAGALLPVPPLPDFSEWGEVEVKPMTGVRRKTAEVTAMSWQQIPHVTQHDQADITDLETLRQEWRAKAEQAGAKLTVTAILLKAVAAALKVFPRFNASVDMENHKIVYKGYIHLAVAVDAGHGLLTPVIRNADRKSVFQIATELGELSAKARGKQLTVEEMSGSTFAVSNLGGVGTTAFGPIVTWPHVGVLGVAKGEIRPVWNGEEFVPRKIMPFSLSYDHRANDGSDAARFMRWLAEALENPLKIAMEAG